MTDRMRRLLEGLRRLARYRLMIPIVRDRNPPDFIARGVAVGVVVALTPTVGIQMPIVALLWLAFRAASKSLDFSLIVGLAWTWLTNVFTMGPCYYIFFVTGQLMLGHYRDVQGYTTFVSLLSETLDKNASFLESLWIYTADLLRIFGVPMFLGSIPWAIAGGWAAYRMSYRYTLAQRERRRRKRERRLLSDSDASQPRAAK